ncbi:MAG TPA: hypothetical protein ENI76_03005 [Ignavibacteria bacterium]|nr:hypothetical protein [Ignavibacteria bacterium]
MKRNHDLVVATHGRGIFVLDNITPLEEMTKKVENSKFHLFTIQPAYFFHYWYRRSIKNLSKYKAPNPPNGAEIDYFLKNSIKTKPNKNKKGKKKHHNVVKIQITGMNGTFIDSLSGKSHKGVNRIVWNLRYHGPKPLNADTAHGKHLNNHFGPKVIPGKYKVKVTANGITESQIVDVKPSPNLNYNISIAKAQLEASLKLRNEVTVFNSMINGIDNINSQISNIKRAIKITYGNKPDMKKEFMPILKKSHFIDSLLTKLKDSVYTSKAQKGVGEDDIHYLSNYYSWLRSLMYSVYGPYNSAPRKAVREQMSYLENQLHNFINKYNNILSVDIPDYNKMAEKRKVPTILVGNTLSY